MSVKLRMATVTVDAVQLTDLLSGDADGWATPAEITIDVEIPDELSAYAQDSGRLHPSMPRRALFTVRFSDPPEGLILWVGKFLRPRGVWVLRGWTPRKLVGLGVPERPVLALPRMEELHVSTQPRIDTPHGLDGPPTGRVELVVTGEVGCRVGEPMWAVDHDDAALDVRLARGA